MIKENHLRIAMTYDEQKQIKLAFGNEVNKQALNHHFKNNQISTTKYNVVTWLPKSLLLQFKRTANIYFLIISILTFFYFSPKNPVTMIGTFAIVLIFTMLKEGYEDIKRYKQDKEINTKFSLVYDKTKREFVKTLWQDIKVGDIVKFVKEESIAADMLLLRSSNETGMCSVDTMNLDGETNLKEKYVSPQLKNKDINEILNMEGIIICDIPNADLDKWECSLMINERMICELKNLVLKGCTLKNTEYIIGVIIYTGHSTKIMKNAKPPPIKTSNVMRLMNKLLYSVFVFQMLLCILFSVGSTYWRNNSGSNLWYLPQGNSSNFIIQFLTFLVAYSHLIPISLYVALEIVKIIQSLLIYYDTNMFDELTMKPAIARTSDLIEELGQVEFIFSDKTGTLTKNEMIFRKCVINNVVYGEVDEDEQTHQERFSINGDPRAYQILMGNKGIDIIDRVSIQDFFTVCSACHSAYVEIKGKEFVYMSSSPDEVALLQGAFQMGFEFCKRTTNTIEVKYPDGKYVTWELFLELPFDSARKRMSVIVREKSDSDINNNKFILFTKGADSEMLRKMELTYETENEIKDALEKFAKEGLRTLIMAKKTLDKSEVDSFLEEYTQISLSTSPDKAKDMLELFEKIESGFNYVGSSAIEDKLQDGVPETIELLMDANIRLWVLTGDKKETAIEIGKSCKLILPEEQMEGIDLASNSHKPETKETFKKKLNSAYINYVEKLAGNMNDLNQMKKLYIIIDGKNLSYVLDDEELGKKFFQIGLTANSVICCRVSPIQKSKVVKLAKDNGTWITLSIGDGANDVPMIMEAHIGIGISGKEGTQAVRAADYAIGQFQFLKRLVLVHGRWGYRRISYFINYYFYKNIVLVFTEVYFAIYNGFSGQIFFPDLLPLCYNAFWTSWPCVFAYTIEKDVDDESSFKFPSLYKAGQQKFYFNLKVFWKWILHAVIHGVVTFYFVNEVGEEILNSEGVKGDHWAFSTLCFSCLVNIVTMKIFIELLHWNLVSLLSSIFSLLFYYICLFVFCATSISKFFQNELINKIYFILSNYKTIVVLIALPLLSLLPDISLRLLGKIFFPSPVEIVKYAKMTQTKIVNKMLKSIIDESKEPIKLATNSSLINGGSFKKLAKKESNLSNRKSKLKSIINPSGKDFLVESIIRKRSEEHASDSEQHQF